MAQTKNNSQKMQHGPLDPTKNAEDLMGDTSGIYGITRGSESKKSTEVPKEAISEKEYTKNTLAGMSTEKAAVAEDVASEPSNNEQTIHDEETIRLDQADKLLRSDFNSETLEKVQNRLRSDYGEESLGGTNEVPENDDDMLQAAQNVGMQLDETEENPQELDIARDIDRAEEAFRTQ